MVGEGEGSFGFCYTYIGIIPYLSNINVHTLAYTCYIHMYNAGLVWSGLVLVGANARMLS
ncbi:hypothetical protein F4809DRAFT_598639 [Biscogniauxia mediterranea]|nr:hypothetical protein F4809DRAFT_598639 [Biscogniauxia mediterranea]